MPEKKLYALCVERGCGEIFEEKLSWHGKPGGVRVYDFEFKSPLIDLLQHHHLETGLLSQHNHYALFASLDDAQQPPLEQFNIRDYHRFPKLIGTLGVTRQRQISFFLLKEPT